VAALRRYAYLQARIRGRIARLLVRRELERLASVPELAALERELSAAGWAQPDERVRVAVAWVLERLDGPPREVVARYQARYACENLKRLLRAVERGLPWAEVAPRLIPDVELGPGRAAREILEARSLAGAVERLEDEPFGAVLRRHARAERGREPDRFRLETVAEREVYERLWAALAALDATDRRAATRLLGLKLDCVNLLRTLRLRHYRGLAPEEIVAYGVAGGLHLGPAQRAALAHEPLEDWPARLAATPYAACAQAESPAALEVALARLLEGAAERELAGSPFQLGLVLAYLLLLELQARDVRRLIEGKRFGVPPERVVAGLVTRRAA
jgi:vacuolar-type H+-ATPase subunit C/Vma6